jgi:hypothetical protein
MTSPWEHPPLHANCIPCLTAENTKLHKEVERLHAELASARTVERKDLHEQVERLTRERDAEVAARQHQWDKRRKAEALLAAQEARAQRVEAALREIETMNGMDIGADTTAEMMSVARHIARDALSQPFNAAPTAAQEASCRSPASVESSTITPTEPREESSSPFLAPPSSPKSSATTGPLDSAPSTPPACSSTIGAPTPRRLAPAIGTGLPASSSAALSQPAATGEGCFECGCTGKAFGPIPCLGCGGEGTVQKAVHLHKPYVRVPCPECQPPSGSRGAP